MNEVAAAAFDDAAIASLGYAIGLATKWDRRERAERPLAPDAVRRLLEFWRVVRPPLPNALLGAFQEMNAVANRIGVATSSRDEAEESRSLVNNSGGATACASGSEPKLHGNEVKMDHGPEWPFECVS